MKLGTLSSARAAYYDRTANTQDAYYNGTVAPHARTQRASTSFSSGKFMIETAHVSAIRATAATTAGNVTVEAQQATGLGDLITLGRAYFNGAAVGTNCTQTTGFQSFANVGDAIYLYTTDLSTGGTVTYWLDIKFTSFYS